MTLQEFEQTCRRAGVESVQVQLRHRSRREGDVEGTVDAIAFNGNETTFATYGEQSIEAALSTIVFRIKEAGL